MHQKIVVYSKSACPNCEAAKKLLASKGLPYTEIKMDNEEERVAFFQRCGPSVRQMPQIFINDQRVGGFEGLRAALDKISSP